VIRVEVVVEVVGICVVKEVTPVAEGVTVFVVVVVVVVEDVVAKNVLVLITIVVEVVVVVVGLGKHSKNKVLAVPPQETTEFVVYTH
jgi:hypothetical protein